MIRPKVKRVLTQILDFDNVEKSQLAIIYFLPPAIIVLIYGFSTLIDVFKKEKRKKLLQDNTTKALKWSDVYKD